MKTGYLSSDCGSTYEDWLSQSYYGSTMRIGYLESDYGNTHEDWLPQ